MSSENSGHFRRNCVNYDILQKKEQLYENTRLWVTKALLGSKKLF